MNTQRILKSHTDVVISNLHLGYDMKEAEFKEVDKDSEATNLNIKDNIIDGGEYITPRKLPMMDAREDSEI